MIDLISRKMAIDALGEKPLAWVESEYEQGLQNQWERDVDAIKSLPSAQPDREKIDEYLLKIWGLEHPLSSATTTIELRWWIKKIYEEIFGEGEKPIWMN